MLNTEEILIYLVSCVVNEASIDNDRITADAADEILRTADFHGMRAIAAAGLYRASLSGLQLSPDQITQSRRYVLSAARRDRLFDAERDEVLSRLEKEKIWYLPLKGILLKTYYPEPYLREMADNDILVDQERAEDVMKIMTSLGYRTDTYGKRHHDNYEKPPFFNFEMHRRLFDSETPLRSIPDYYSDVTKLLKKDRKNEYGYHLSDENFYLYMISHEYKHYILFGTGLRSLLDTYVFLKTHSDRLDWNYIKEESGKLKISGFEERNRSLAMKLFSTEENRELDDDEKEMLFFISESGTYGRQEHLAIKKIHSSGMFQYVFRRIFLPMESIRRIYPFFYRHRILIPFLPLYRVFHLRRRMIAEIGFLRNFEKLEKKHAEP